MKKTIVLMLGISFILVMSSAFVSADSCYPSYNSSTCFKQISECIKNNCNKKILCSDRVYLGVIEDSNSHIYVYGNKPFVGGIEQKSGLDLSFYLWKGAPCKDDEYMGRIYGTAEAYKKNHKVCLKNWNAQIKESNNKWRTYSLGGGCMDDKDAFKLGIKLALFPHILKKVVTIPIWGKAIKSDLILPGWLHKIFPIKWTV